ncbi:hypothetical protein SJU67_10415 [Aeromonas caviae]|uniref:hypothetical protein n=1 Tax=Aeromonas caviae TaxID=648 RepID=UPI0029D4431E|nr:hypothetical protein [Aeromonas caviae]MDX7692171.1 hypothetical protein [Aeromonas caviae]
MRFQQIKDLMLYLEELHHRQGHIYGRQIPRVDAERSRMLLAYLQGREDAAAAHLHDYREQMGSAVKETWLDQGFGEDLLAEGDRLALPATTQPAEIVALVSRQEERLIGELERLARECPTPDTAALLKALSSMAQSRLTRLVHGAHRLDDL